jgi:hypothetical protein
MRKITLLVFIILGVNSCGKTVSHHLELNAEIKYYNNLFEIKNCDNFIWKNVRIGLHSWNYKYENIIEKIEPNELYLIEFSKFINNTGTFDEIGTPFDGKKLKLGSTEPCYTIAILTEDNRLNGYWLYVEGQIGTRNPINEWEDKKIYYLIPIICLLGVITVLIIKFSKKKNK